MADIDALIDFEAPRKSSSKSKSVSFAIESCTSAERDVEQESCSSAEAEFHETAYEECFEMDTSDD